MSTCVVCDAKFPSSQRGVGRPKIYCSPECSSAARRRRAGVPLKGTPGPERLCIVCGLPFSPVNRRQYCSPACRATASRRGRGIEPRSPIQSRIYPCLNCGRDATRSRFCSVRCRAEYVVPAIPCIECAVPFIPTHRAQQYCSIPCRKRTGDRLGRERGKSWAVDTYANSGGNTPYRQAKSRLEGALRRGARVPGELIVPAEVFERDGWVCGLCGEDVDRSLKWPDPMSVSLDHVIPVSMGGMHSMVNLQTAHLFCNVSKGNRVASEVSFDPHAPTPRADLLEP